MSSKTVFSRRNWVRAAAFVAVASALALPALLSAEDLQLPKDVTLEAAEQMYAEQIASQSSIKELVEGRIEAFEITKRLVGVDEAELELRVIARDGVVRQGVMRVVKADGKWYFASITPAGMENVSVALPADYDVGVLNTILAEQTEHADAVSKIVDGTYRKVTVGEPLPGYRSTVLPVIFTGGNVKAQTGEVTAIERIDGAKSQWFIASFEAK